MSRFESYIDAKRRDATPKGGCPSLALLVSRRSLFSVEIGDLHTNTNTNTNTNKTEHLTAKVFEIYKY